MKVLVTGATKGIGRAIAQRFAEAGYDIIACARTEEDLIEMSGELRTQFPGIAVIVKPIDLADAMQLKELGQWITETRENIDVLVNNAGYFIPGTVHEEEDGNLERMMEVNVYSAYHLCRALLPSMISRKHGHIFNICSIAAFQPLPNVGSYGISKFALLGLTKHLREEMKPYGIKVTAVLPGATMTASWDGADIDPERIMEANDVAEMVLASTRLSHKAVVEDIILRPQLGDL